MNFARINLLFHYLIDISNFFIILYIIKILLMIIQFFQAKLALINIVHFLILIKKNLIRNFQFITLSLLIYLIITLFNLKDLI